MNCGRAARRCRAEFTGLAGLLIGIGLLLHAAEHSSAQTAATQSASAGYRSRQPAPTGNCDQAIIGSPYIPVDNWMYPAVFRLYSMGYVDHIYLGMRPWTRKNIIEILRDVEDRIADSSPSASTDQAQEIHQALEQELQRDVLNPCAGSTNRLRFESAYTVFRGMSGAPLRDSFHLGSTLINDYGRPYENGSITIPESAATHL